MTILLKTHVMKMPGVNHSRNVLKLVNCCIVPILWELFTYSAGKCIRQSGQYVFRRDHSPATKLDCFTLVYPWRAVSV